MLVDLQTLIHNRQKPVKFLDDFQIDLVTRHSRFMPPPVLRGLGVGLFNLPKNLLIQSTVTARLLASQLHAICVPILYYTMIQNRIVPALILNQAPA